MKTLIALFFLTSVSYANPQEHQFLAVATGATATVDTAYGHRVVGFGKGQSKDAASRDAMAKCQGHDEKYADAAANCAITLEQDTGCLFYTYGGTPWGDSGMGFGSTPQEAYNSCHSFNGPMDCLPKVKGECTDAPFVREWPAIEEAPKVKAWIGLAVGSSTVADGRPVVIVGRGWGPDEASAKINARTDCSNGLHKVVDANCRGGVYAFENGCRYISYSFKADQKTPVLKFGKTKEEDQEACLIAGGTSCDTDADVVGGCAQ